MSGKRPIYLDYNATAPLAEQAAEAMAGLGCQPANPSSVHYFGRKARAIMDSARMVLANALKVSPHELIFTSGGTEANNLVIKNFSHIITSTIEHDAILAACPDAQLIEVDTDGRICLSQLEAALQPMPETARASTLVSVMAANNETGVIQPLAEIAQLCQSYGIACHSDMIQYLGKADIDLAQSGLDFASFSAHKIGGPTGMGVLWCRSGRLISSLLKGGGQEQGRRAGTENLPGIAGFAAAMAIQEPEKWQQQSKWRDAAETQICSACPEIEVMGRSAERLANTSALYLPGIEAQTAVMQLDLAGFAVSAGSACSSGKVKASHVITAMARPEAAGQVIRISSGWQTPLEDWLGVAEAVIALYKRKLV